MNVTPISTIPSAEYDLEYAKRYLASYPYAFGSL
jgi:hypothetical protein